MSVNCQYCNRQRVCEVSWNSVWASGVVSVRLMKSVCDTVQLVDMFFRGSMVFWKFSTCLLNQDLCFISQLLFVTFHCYWVCDMLFTTSSTRTGLGLNLCHHSERPLNNCLNSGTTINLIGFFLLTCTFHYIVIKFICCSVCTYIFSVFKWQTTVSK